MKMSKARPGSRQVLISAWLMRQEVHDQFAGRNRMSDTATARLVTQRGRRKGFVPTSGQSPAGETPVSGVRKHSQGRGCAAGRGGKPSPALPWLW